MFNEKIYNAEQLAKLVHDTIEYNEKVAQEAQDRARKTREEVKAEILNEYAEENARLKKLQELTLVSFNSDEEKKMYNEFLQEHITRHFGAAPRKYMPNLELIPFGDGMGTGLKVRCPICKEEADVTDYNMW